MVASASCPRCSVVCPHLSDWQDTHFPTHFLRNAPGLGCCGPTSPGGGSSLRGWVGRVFGLHHPKHRWGTPASTYPVTPGSSTTSPPDFIQSFPEGPAGIVTAAAQCPPGTGAVCEWRVVPDQGCFPEAELGGPRECLGPVLGVDGVAEPAGRRACGGQSHPPHRPLVPHCALQGLGCFWEVRSQPSTPQDVPDNEGAPNSELLLYLGKALGTSESL